MNDKLREHVREQAGKKPTPTVDIIDSQSVKATEVGVKKEAVTQAKEIAVRKPHIAVDTLGLLLTVVVHGANWQDQDDA